MSGRLPRKAYLNRRARLHSTAALKRYTQLAPASAKRAAAGAQPARPKDTGPDRGTRELVYERDDYSCAWCGITILNRQYSLQHRRSRGDGGSSDPRINAPSNLITLCGSATSPGGCHLKCKQQYTEAEALGFVVSLNSAADPADVPVLHAMYGLVFLNDDGSVTIAGGEAA
jgi:5-methylcytosine-specific restriction enzyme A